MAKTITKKFISAAFISVSSAALVSLILSIIGGLLSSDIMITGSSSAAVRFLPAALSYSALFFNSTAIAFAVAAVFYALTYFGGRTARRISLTAVLSFLAVYVISFAYSALTNDLSLARMLAAALTLLIDLAYFAATLAAAWLICSIFIKKGSVSFILPALTVNAVLLAVRLADLTFSAVVPFVLNNTVISSDIRTIVGDYIYYTVSYGILPFVLTLLSTMLYKKITGALVPKISIKTKETEN